MKWREQLISMRRSAAFNLVIAIHFNMRIRSVTSNISYEGSNILVVAKLMMLWNYNSYVMFAHVDAKCRLSTTSFHFADINDLPVVTPSIEIKDPLASRWDIPQVFLAPQSSLFCVMQYATSLSGITYTPRSQIEP